MSSPPLFFLSSSMHMELLRLHKQHHPIMRRRPVFRGSPCYSQSLTRTGCDAPSPDSWHSQLPTTVVVGQVSNDDTESASAMDNSEGRVLFEVHRAWAGTPGCRSILCVAWCKIINYYACAACFFFVLSPILLSNGTLPPVPRKQTNGIPVF